MCFSCGKSGHAATRCPNLDESFPFMQPGWRADKTPGGFMTADWRVCEERRCWIAEWGETLASPDVAGSLLPVVPAGGSPLDGAVLQVARCPV